MKRSLISVFIPDPFAFMRNVEIRPEPKYEEIRKADRRVDGYALFLAERFAVMDEKEDVRAVMRIELVHESGHVFGAINAEEYDVFWLCVIRSGKPYWVKWADIEKLIREDQTSGGPVGS